MKMPGRTLISYVMQGTFTSLVCFISLIKGECFYSTWVGHIFTFGPVTETYHIEEFRGDCEFLCFKSPTCRAANVRRLQNGTITCEFRSLIVDQFTDALIVPEAGSKYIQKTDAGPNVPWPLPNTGTTCSVSSTYGGDESNYPCDYSLDKLTTSIWFSASPAEGQWFQIILPVRLLVYRLDMMPQCVESYYISSVDLLFSDGEGLQYPRLSCNSRGDICTTGERLIIPPVSTTSIRILFVATCSPVPWASMNYFDVYGYQQP